LTEDRANIRSAHIVANPDSANPDSANPDSANPDSANPDSANPDSAHSAGQIELLNRRNDSDFD
jgi:hypothetical protein